MDREKWRRGWLRQGALLVLWIWALWHLPWLGRGLGFVLHLFLPFGAGLALAFLWNIPLAWLEKRLPRGIRRGRRPLALGLSFLLVAAGLGLLSVLIVPALQRTGAVLTEGLPAFWESLRQRLSRAVAGLPGEGAPFGASLERGAQLFCGAITRLGADLSQKMPNRLSAGEAALNLGLGLVFAIYILLQKEKLGRQLGRVLRAWLPSARVEQLEEAGRLASRVFAGFLTGQLGEAAILGGLCWLGMLLLRLPCGAAVSALVAVTALIPVFGALAGMLLGALLIALQSPGKALWFLLFLIVLQQIEGNVIYPRVVGRSVGLPGLWVLLAVTVGGRAGGLWGILLGVPLCALAYALVQARVRQRLQQKGEP